MANGGSERKRRWKENKRSQGWAWSDIQGPRSGGRSLRSTASSASNPFNISRDDSSHSLQSIAGEVNTQSGMRNSKVNLGNTYRFNSIMRDLCKSNGWPEYVCISSNVSWKIVSVRKDSVAELLNLERWDFTCFNPEFSERRSQSLTAQRASIRMLRGGEPYVMSSNWATSELVTPNLLPYDSWPVAYVGGVVDSLTKLLQAGLLLFGLLLPGRKILLVQLDFCMKTKPSRFELPQVIYERSKCLENKSPNDNSILPNPPPGFETEASPRAAAVSGKGLKNETLYKTMTGKHLFECLRDSLGVVSPSLAYAMIDSRVNCVGKKERVQIVLQILVDPSKTTKTRNKFHSTLWPSMLYDLDVPLEESTWILEDPNGFIPVAICTRCSTESFISVLDQRKKDLLEILEKRANSVDYVWSAATDRQSPTNDWVSLPQSAQDVINKSWKEGLAVSKPFPLNVTLICSGSLSRDGDRQPLGNMWDVLFSMPVLRNCEKRSIWTPLRAHPAPWPR